MRRTPIQAFPLASASVKKERVYAGANLKACFLRGRKDAAAGRSLNACPYRRLDKADAWERGWREVRGFKYPAVEVADASF